MKKNTTLNFLIAVALMFILNGCGSSLMTKVPTIEQPDNGMALVTIFRASGMGPAVKYNLWDGDHLLGILNVKSYIQYQTTPGHHLFMVRSESWSAVDAELQAGRHYFIVARPVMGAWKQRLILDPISREQYDKEPIDEWLKELTPTGMIPEKVENYVAPRLEQVRKTRDNFESGIGTTLTLNPDDGI